MPLDGPQLLLPAQMPFTSRLRPLLLLGLAVLAAIVTACRDDRTTGMRPPTAIHPVRTVTGVASATSSTKEVGGFVDVKIYDINVDGAPVMGAQGVIQYDTARLTLEGIWFQSDSTDAYISDTVSRGTARFAVLQTSANTNAWFVARFKVKAANYLQGATISFSEVVRASDYSTVIGNGTVSPVGVDTSIHTYLRADRSAPERFRQSAELSADPPPITMFGDVDPTGDLDKWDYRLVLRWIIGELPAPSYSSSSGIAANVAPANSPGLGGAGDAIPPGLEQDCTRRYSISDAARIAAEIAGSAQSIVGESIPANFGVNLDCGSVALEPPDSTPAWFLEDSSSTPGAPYVKNVLTVMFKEGTSLADRETAISTIGGSVIGGSRIPLREGEYLVLVPANGDLGEMRRLAAIIRALPYVRYVAFWQLAAPGYITAYDGAGWRNWSLSPERIPFRNDRWGLEAINAPHAWGCETGRVETKVAVMDRDFPMSDDFRDMIEGSEASVIGDLSPHPGEPDNHGAAVTSVMTARGNDSSGMTGVMWRSRTQVHDFAKDGLKAYRKAAEWGAVAVNLSYWFQGTAPSQDLANDNLRLQSQFAEILASLAGRNIPAPLLVVIAGNGGNTGLTLYDAGYPQLRYVDSTVVLVVGAADLGAASAQGQRFARASFTQLGDGIDLYAPGVSIGVNVKGSIVPESGTSVAAPLVAGTAGLLHSFGLRGTGAIRRAILEGARRAGRKIDSVTTGAPVKYKYLLDAYEAIRVAAEVPGARLCGNRYFEHAPGVWAIQRDPGPIGVQAEYLTGESGASGARRTWIEHGGRYFVVRDQTTGFPSEPGVYNAVRGYYFEHGPGGFSLQAFVPPGPLPGAYTSTRYDSLLYYNPTRVGVRHGGGQIVYVTDWTESNATVVRETHTATSFQVDTIGRVPLAQSPGAQWYLTREMYLCQISDEFDDTCNDTPSWYRMDSTFTDLDGRAFVLFPEYSPFNDSVFVAAVQTDFTRSISSDWIEEQFPVPAEGCGNFPSEGPGFGWWKVLASRCKRFSDVDVTTTRSMIYGLRVPNAGQPAATASLQAVSSMFNDKRIYWFNIPEGNREWIVATGTPTASGAVPSDCSVAWRDRRTAAVLATVAAPTSCRNDPWEMAGSALRIAEPATTRALRVGGRSRLVR